LWVRPEKEKEEKGAEKKRNVMGIGKGDGG
jgi:hypothetical protein